MKNYKNYLIALLTGLLVLSLSTQQAQSAGTSTAAKAILYEKCLDIFIQGNNVSEYRQVPSLFLVNDFASFCAKYRP
jgi:hypothetical protein